MEVKFIALLITLASSCLASVELQCPEECQCKSYRFKGVVATCSGSIFDRLPLFPKSVSHLKIDNWDSPHGVVLKDRIFIDMNLENLYSIHIRNSSLKEVHFNAFHGLRRLKSIDFSNNKIRTLIPDTFLKSKELEHVILNGNPIVMSEQNDSPFLNSDSITELLLSGCNITSLPSKAFSNLKSLEYIDLSQNDLTEIPLNIFDQLIGLEVIDLSENSISKIDKNVFIDLDELIHLSLRGNPIKTLEGIEIENLKELDVSDCNLELLMADTFAGISALQNLNLSRNSIRDINKETFTDLIYLRYLDLSYNNLRGPLDKFLFENNVHLETLSFAGNRELALFPGFAKPSNSLYKLDLSDCGLTNLTPQSFKLLPYVDSLNISGNELVHLPPKVFNYMPHLTILDISRNKLHYLNNKIFFGNPHLHKLFMSHNYFSLVPAILFSNVPTLSWLDVSNNHVIRLWNISESFVMKNKNILGKLTFLNVAGNKLKTLHMHSFISMRVLETLDISENPIICTQDFSHVMQWLIGKKVEPYLKPRNSETISLINNNIQWEKILNEICPMTVVYSKKTFHKVETDINEKKNQAEKNSYDQIEITEKPDELNDETPYVVNPLNETVSSLMWPMVLIWVSILSILLAVGNLVALLIYRSRRNYGSTTYTPAPSLNGQFLVRRGGKSVYKKLYAECSEPAQIHSNSNKTSRIITIFGFPQNKTNSSV